VHLRAHRVEAVELQAKIEHEKPGFGSSAPREPLRGVPSLTSPHRARRRLPSRPHTAPQQRRLPDRPPRPQVPHEKLGFGTSTPRVAAITPPPTRRLPTRPQGELPGRSAEVVNRLTNPALFTGHHRVRHAEVQDALESEDEDNRRSGGDGSASRSRSRSRSRPPSRGERVGFGTSSRRETIVHGEPVTEPPPKQLLSTPPSRKDAPYTPLAKVPPLDPHAAEVVDRLTNPALYTGHHRIRHAEAEMRRTMRQQRQQPRYGNGHAEFFGDDATKQRLQSYAQEQERQQRAWSDPRHRRPAPQSDSAAERPQWDNKVTDGASHHPCYPLARVVPMERACISSPDTSDRAQARTHARARTHTHTHTHTRAHTHTHFTADKEGSRDSTA
jgi:hypothetical protein